MKIAEIVIFMEPEEKSSRKSLRNKKIPDFNAWHGVYTTNGGRAQEKSSRKSLRNKKIPDFNAWHGVYTTNGGWKSPGKIKQKIIEKQKNI